MGQAADDAALVRRGYEAFNTADMHALTEIFDEDASWHTPGRSPLAGDYQGRDAVFGQFGRYAGGTAGTFRAELLDVFADGDGRAVGIHRNSAQREGRQLAVTACLVFEIKDGRCVSGTEYFNDLYAWDEFWS